jgi:hypothetical protein
VSLEPYQLGDVPLAYPQEYERGLRLPAGRIVLIRPIMPTDAPQLAEATAPPTPARSTAVSWAARRI